MPHSVASSWREFTEILFRHQALSVRAILTGQLGKSRPAIRKLRRLSTIANVSHFQRLAAAENGGTSLCRASACPDFGYSGQELAGLLLCLAMLFPLVGSAQSVPRPEDFYRIEILVFERLGESRNELHHINQPLPTSEEAVELLNPDPFEEAAANSRYFTQVDPEARQFNDDWITLEESPNYRPLVHLAWEQPQYPFESPQTVRLNGGIALVKASNDLGEFVFTDRTSRPGAEPLYELDGTAAFSRSRFMHLGLDLLLRRRPIGGDWRPGLALPRLGGRVDEEQFIEYRIRERLRIRSDEVYYYDNKHFGAMAIVTHPYSNRTR